MYAEEGHEAENFQSRMELIINCLIVKYAWNMEPQEICTEVVDAKTEDGRVLLDGVYRNVILIAMSASLNQTTYFSS